MKKLLFATFLLAAFMQAQAQLSIHAEENALYKTIGIWPDENLVTERFAGTDTCSLKKVVFGYHPYWVGSVWNSYNWNLLSDLCYFSYEVDPATGLSTTQNDWQTAAVIDTANAHGTRVHLCITLFSGHSTFFSNITAQQTLIDTTIKLLTARNAIGVNLDFEAVPSSLAEQYNAFLTAFADSVHNSIPGSIVSMASPAVDWSSMLDIAQLSEHLDYFMIMGYDYYWSGSSTAGPVAGLYPMESGYQYAVSSTIRSYLNKGAPAEKLLLGVPYYGRNWAVNKEVAPASTMGGSYAITYKNYRNNTVDYNWSTQRFENNSQALYYSYDLSGWRHCFIDDATSLAQKFDLVNRSSLAGTGVWALGYDNGYNDLWDVIRNKFSFCAQPLCSDTLYDTGGPAFNYKQDEDYIQTISIGSGQTLTVDLLEFNTEAGADSLFFFDGLNTSAPLLAAYSGTRSPITLFPTGNSFTYRFKSNSTTQHSGFKLVFKCPSAGENEITANSDDLKVFPNPGNGNFSIAFSEKPLHSFSLTISDISGRILYTQNVTQLEDIVRIEPEIRLKKGIYFLNVEERNKPLRSTKLIIN